MTSVVRFESTKRKLDWKQEETLREGKKKSKKIRDSRIQGREMKTIGDDE